MRLAVVLALMAAPALADGRRALDQVFLPGTAAFAESAATLARTAAMDCSPAAVLPAYHAARDAWGRIGDFRIGPTEQAALTIAFWPDDRASGLRALRAGAEVPPASARGFSGLDLMLGEPSLAYGPGDPGCGMVVSLTEDLSQQAQALALAWQDFAPELANPGLAGITYLDAADVNRALYTQLLAALELTLHQRLGRPMERPTRAEHWRTGRPLPNVLASVLAVQALARALADGPTPQIDAAVAGVQMAALSVSDPSFQDAGDPQARLRLEALGQRLARLRRAIEEELGAAQGLQAGFNALDGD